MAQKILAVVSEPISAEALRSAIGGDPSDAEVLVVAPALRGKFRWVVDDPDKSIGRAEEVQEETVERLEEEGVDAAGDTGEADPLLAVQDALQTYPADQVVFFTHREGSRNWLEEGVVEEARERFDADVEHMVLD